MEKNYRCLFATTITLMMFWGGVISVEASHSDLYNKHADNIITTTYTFSNEELWFINEKGELFVRESDRLHPEDKDSIIYKIDEVSDAYSLSSYPVNANYLYIIKKDGRLWKLTKSTDKDQVIIEPIRGVKNCVKVCVGKKYAIALCADGSVYSIGENDFGHIGKFSNMSNTPKKIKELSDVVDISLSSDHCMALTGSGNVYTWGCNASGQLGDGTRTKYKHPGDNLIVAAPPVEKIRVIENNDRDSPYLVEELSDIIQISAGMEHSAALRKDGIVFQWGMIQAIGGHPIITKPEKIEGLEKIVQISADGFDTIVISSSGDVLRRGYARLYYPDNQISPPVKTELSNVKKIIPRYFNEFAITNDNVIVGQYVEMDGSEKVIYIISQEDMNNLSNSKVLPSITPIERKIVESKSNDGKSVDVIVSALITNPNSAIDLSGSTYDEISKKFKAKLDKVYDNVITVVKMGQSGSYGMNVTIAVKSPIKNITSPFIYRYDEENQKYVPLKDANPRISNNAYINFNTDTGGIFIISEGSLKKK